MNIRPEWSQRLLRKGVLVQETYALFAAWDDGASVADNLKSALSGRHKTAGWEREVHATLNRRLRDVGQVRPLITLARRGMPIADWRDCMRLWIGATEQPFHDFATGWLFNEHEKGRYQIRSEDVRPVFEKAAAARDSKTKALSEYAQLRGARDLLKMGVDLGLLAGGGPVKTFASIAMSDDVTLFYAHMISELESNTKKMLSSRLWRLAYMAPKDVHVALLRLHQYRRLNYEIVGNIAEVGLPFESALECAERIAA